MTEINVREARKRFGELLEKCQRGEEVTILRHGKAVARWVPAERPTKKLPILDEFRQEIGSSGRSSVELIREERDAR